MESLLSLLGKYGWQMFLLGVLGSAAIGAIKSPIRSFVFNKHSHLDKDSTEYKSIEDKFDTFVFLGTFLVAGLVSLIYLYLANKFSWAELLSDSIAVWLIQSAVYGIWRKLGLKRLLQAVYSAVRKAAEKRLDKNKDGRITFDEAILSIKNLVKNGKLDISEVLKNTEQMLPEIIEDVAKDLTEEAGEAGLINTEEEVDKLETTIKETLADALEPVSEIPGLSNVVDMAKEKVSIIKLK